jgi:hypothetical protein
MLNCVRFGTVNGSERAFVSGQNGLIYIFSVPSWTSPERIPVRSSNPLQQQRRILACCAVTNAADRQLCTVDLRVLNPCKSCQAFVKA